MAEPLLYETHSHTPLCHHAIGEPAAYAQHAIARGLRGLTVTCHNPMPDGFSRGVRMAPEEFAQYAALIQQTREAFDGRLDVRMGLECDYFPGYEWWLQEQLASAEFHFILGSVHPQIGEVRERFWTGDPVEYQRTYFQLLGDAAETGLFDSLAHPDLVKNITPSAWRPDEVMDDILRALDRIAATGMAMELNTSGVNKSVPEMNPFPEMLRAMRAREIPVTIGADAHEPDRVADGYETALKLLQSCGYESVSYFLDRRRRDLPINDALASLRPMPLTL